MKTKREQLIGQLKAIQDQIGALLESVADNQDWQPEPGQWSFRYIAAHMATVEKECHQARLVRLAAGGESPHFAPYFNTGRDFSQLALEDSLQAWAITRGEIFDFLDSLPEEKWSLSGTHATFGPITILDILQMMLDHDQEHLGELEALIDLFKAS